MNIRALGIGTAYLRQPNGEVEGPRRGARYAPRAHTVFQRPRRVTTGASRPPPTIVRRYIHLCAAPENMLAQSVHVRDGPEFDRPLTRGVFLEAFKGLSKAIARMNI